MVTKKLLTAIAFGLSMGAHAADFSDADAKFALRDTTREANDAARTAYKAIVDQGVKDAELIRAAEGYLRTQIFEGTHYTSLLPEVAKGTTEIPAGKAPFGAGRETRKAIFTDCANNIAEILSPAKLGSASAVYYYFKASCIAYQAEVSTPLERLVLLSPLNKALDAGLATDGGTTYEGGGLLRVRAAVLGNPEAKGLPGVYNPKQALVLIDQAIASEAYPDSVEGSLFCENFRRKIGIEVELGTAESKAAALSIANQTLADFQSYLDDGLLPEFIRAETADCLKTVQAQKASL